VARSKTQFTCQSCGFQAAKWLGKCPDCGGWNTLVEELAPEPGDRRSPWGATSGASRPVKLEEVCGEAEIRHPTGIAELDRVLGGGVVDGSLVLLGGDPGIGKSTLLLAALDRLARERPALYVSGEESLRQTKMRAERLSVRSSQLHLFSETDAEKVLVAAENLKPAALVVDSIQTMYLPDLGSAPGSISQVREVAGRLMAFAKRSSVPTFLVGHVTKAPTPATWC
jgi:DNA repair protein RadA/Sms